MSGYHIETTLQEKIGYLSPAFLLMIAIVSLIGIANLYSAAEGNFEPWAWRQGVRFLLTFPLVILIALVDIRIWFRSAYALYGFGLAFLLLVEIIGFVGMGAQRWVNLGGVNFQPSELMKVLTVLALARYFHSVHANEVPRMIRLVIPAAMVIVPAGLIFIQPNLGTATILMIVGATVFFMAGVGWKKFAVIAVIVLASLPLVWSSLHDYQKNRVLTFLDPERDPLGNGYNILQSKIAIGSGGLAGKGFIQGTQSQLRFLPEKHTDFVFTMIAEEFGFLGGVLVLFLYTALFLYGLKVALQSQSMFGKLIAVGVSMILAVHMLINVAMVIGLIPVVGVPLPLLSYGGSSQIAMMIGFGFILNALVHQEVIVRRTTADM